MGIAGRALVGGALVLASAGCWPVPGHDPDWSGYNDLEATITPETVAALEERWTWSSGSSGFPVRSPVVSAGGVHVMSGCSLATINLVSGTQRWQVGVPTVPPGQGGSWLCGSTARALDPFVIGDQVYAGGVLQFSGRNPPAPMPAYFRASTASWHVATGEPGAGPDVVGALAARRDGIVASLDGWGGYGEVGPPAYYLPHIEVWLALGPLGGTTRAIPTTNNGEVTLGTDGVYVAFGPSLTAFAVHDPELTCGEDGTEECPLWSARFDGFVAGRPVLGPGGTTVYVGTDAGTVHALDAATGATSWTATLGAAVTGPPARAHGTLYVPTAGGDLVALAAGGCGAPTCAPVWSAPTGSPLSGQPVVAGDVVVTGSEEGALRAFDAAGCGDASCPPLWSASVGSEVTGMAVSGGQLYVGTADGRLVAYGLPDDVTP